ncbi:hypothetical protein L917_19207 [Phytophthora nicotianae]|uniref:Uncharacterized protein n=3 Tax=Phytophthora nicotianae TaxID=4792 RepID=V9E2I2_PHYNI|nr:hypothetical protein F443_20025 [Phytophthora nicotianae P1569]ETL80287.1 hypothetical protein L917_19207 [Phytophthora nicotianae]ETM33533.1 hypothetical protein L914_19248 [Phytophthora nicotianae]
MVNRYCRLEPVLRSVDHGTIAEYALDELMLTRGENERVFALRDTMEKMEGVTQALQHSTLTLSGTRRLFDRVVAEFPQLRSRLAPTAAIVNNTPLESVLVKLQHQEQLTAAERSACTLFRLSDSSDNGVNRKRWDVHSVEDVRREMES